MWTCSFIIGREDRKNIAPFLILYKNKTAYGYEIIWIWALFSGEKMIFY